MQAERQRFLAGILAGVLAQFCAALNSAGFDFDFGEKLLRYRRQFSGPGCCDNHRRKPRQWDHAHSGRRFEAGSGNGQSYPIAIGDVMVD